MVNRVAMVDACCSYRLPPRILQCKDPKVQFPEPYIPFMPDPWNGVLVLAEAQNLSLRHKDYHDKLAGMAPLQRVTRLQNPGGKLGVQPWDNGLLKLAVEAALDSRAGETAVSNGVLWSLADAKGRNVNPTGDLIEHSARLWIELLKVLQPKCVVAAGAVAREVLKAVPTGAWQGPILQLHLPAPRVLATLKGLFHVPDLLAHYPEVAAVQKEHPEWFPKDADVSSRVAYACHAVSHARRVSLPENRRHPDDSRSDP